MLSVARTTLVAVAPPNLDPGKDWQAVGFIHYRASSSFRWEIESYLTAQHLNPRIAGEADDSAVMIEAAVRGGYVVIVPRAIARERIASGELEVLAHFEPSQCGVYAVFQIGAKAELARRAVDVLIAHVRARAD